MRGADAVGRLPDRCQRRHVDLEELGPIAAGRDLVDNGLAARGVAGSEHDSGPLLRERPRRLEPDSRSGARDENRFAGDGFGLVAHTPPRTFAIHSYYRPLTI